MTLKYNCAVDWWLPPDGTTVAGTHNPLDSEIMIEPYLRVGACRSVSDAFLGDGTPEESAGRIRRKNPPEESGGIIRWDNPVG